MTEPLGLDSLLADLRSRGLSAGPLEYERLRRAFEARVDASWEYEDEERAIEHLVALLRCTLVKDRRQRPDIENAVRLWLKRAAPFVEEVQNLRDNAVPPSVVAQRIEDRLARLPGQATPRRKRPWRRKRWLIAVLVALAVSAAAWWIVRPSDSTGSGQTGSGTTDPFNNDPPKPPEPLTIPVREQEIIPEVFVPTLSPRLLFVRPTPPVPFHWILIQGSTLILTGILVFVWRRRLQALEIEPISAEVSRRARRPHLQVPAITSSLFEPEAARQMVWGVEQFVADEVTNRIDLPATVKATARAAGIVTLRRERPRLDRTIWIWRDESTEGAELERLQREVAQVLGAAGLPVRQASFWGVPHRPRWLSDDTQLSPLAVEGNRDSVIVLILTDGRKLRIELSNALKRGRTRELLRSLATWPRLTFVAMGDESSPLPRLARELRLTCISPREIPDFLGANVDFQPRSEARTTRQRPLQGELRWWAASLALSDQPFDEGTAWAVRDALGLGGDSLDVAALRNEQYVEPVGFRYRFKEGLRNEGPDGSNRVHFELLDWLSRAEDHRREGQFFVTPTSRLARILTFWRQRLEVSIRSERLRNEQPEEECPEVVSLRMAQALLDLWDKPDQAADRLEALVKDHPHLRSAIREKLRRLLPRITWSRDLYLDTEAPVSCLPWKKDDPGLDAATFGRLVGLGLGEGRLSRKQPPLPPVARGLLAVLSLLFLVSLAVMQLPERPPARPSHVLRSMIAGVKVDDDDIPFLQLQTSKHAQRIRLGQPGGLYEVTLTSTAVPNPQVLEEEGVEVWRAGHSSSNLRPHLEGWPEATIVCLIGNGAPSDNWKAWIADMLDTGAVDVVYVGAAAVDRVEADWKLDTVQVVVITPSEAVPQITATKGRWAHVVTADPATVPVPKDIAPKKLEDLWGKDRVTQVDSAKPVRLAKGEALLEMLAIPEGTVTLGSSTQEREEFSKGDEEILSLMADEGPVLDVEVKAFEMSRTEVTREVWRSVMPVNKDRNWPPDSWEKDGSDGSLPANDLTWFDVLEFCNALSIRQGLKPAYVIERNAADEMTGVEWTREANGYRLPTEAEWEYACRAGTNSPYPWEGTDTDSLDKHAVWNLGLDGEPKPVATKSANAFGLHDMIGNVEEWCWDAYAEEHDPKGRDGSVGDSRVLRGGFFGNVEPRELRPERPFRDGSFRVGYPEGLRSAARSRLGPERRFVATGFRCVRSPRRQH